MYGCVPIPGSTHDAEVRAERSCSPMPVFIGKIVPRLSQATVGEVVQGWESSLDVPGSNPTGTSFFFFFSE